MMTKKRSVKVLALLLCVLFIASTFSGCALITGGTERDDILRVIVPVWTNQDMVATELSTKRLNYLTDILAQNGFNVVFEVYSTNLGSTYAKEYLQDTSSMLRGRNNVVCLYPVLGVDQYTSAACAADVTALVKECAPTLYAEWLASEDDGDGIYYVPASILSEEESRLAIVIRNDVAAAYGKEVRTASEYVAFLKWAKEQYPDETPGLFPIELYMSAYGDPYEAFDFFAPEYGYYSIDHSLGVMGAGVYAPLAADAEGTELYTAEQLDFYVDVLDELKALGDEGLVKFLSTATAYEIGPKSEYISAVVNTADFTGNGLEGQLQINELAFDATGYTMYVMYNETIPAIWDDTVSVSYAGIVGTSTSEEYARTFISMLEWMHTSADNYLLFSKGVEGTDYTLEDGRLNLLDTDLDYSGYNVLNFFRDSRYEMVAANAPDNYEEELAGISHPSSGFTDLIEKNEPLFRSYLLNKAMSATAGSIIESRYDDLDTLYREIYIEDNSNYKSWIDSLYTRQTEDAVELINLLVEALREADAE